LKSSFISSNSESAPGMLVSLANTRYGDKMQSDSPFRQNQKSRRNRSRRPLQRLLFEMALVAEGTDRFAVIGRLFGCSRFQAGDTVEWHESGVFGFFLQHDLAI